MYVNTLTSRRLRQRFGRATGLQSPIVFDRSTIRILSQIQTFPDIAARFESFFPIQYFFRHRWQKQRCNQRNWFRFRCLIVVVENACQTTLQIICKIRFTFFTTGKAISCSVNLPVRRFMYSERVSRTFSFLPSILREFISLEYHRAIRNVLQNYSNINKADKTQTFKIVWRVKGRLQADIPRPGVRL